MRIFYESFYCSLDFQNKKLNVVEKKENSFKSSQKSLVETPIDINEVDALEEEIKDFINCIYCSLKPKVDADYGIRALETAEMIEKLINKSTTIGSQYDSNG